MGCPPGQHTISKVLFRFKQRFSSEYRFRRCQCSYDTTPPLTRQARGSGEKGTPKQMPGECLCSTQGETGPKHFTTEDVAAPQRFRCRISYLRDISLRPGVLVDSQGLSTDLLRPVIGLLLLRGKGMPGRRLPTAGEQPFDPVQD